MVESVIIDDEPNNVSSLQNLLEKYCPEIHVIGTAGDSNEGFALIQELSPQLVFMDIEMPYGNAFDLLNRFDTINFEVIFITAFDNYAIKAFKYSALDYLLKPVNIEELKTAVEKVTGQSAKKNVNLKVANLLQNIERDKGTMHKLAIPTTDGLTFINTDQIIRMEARKNYTVVYTDDEKKIIATKTLGSFEELLPEAVFFRVHHSHIVNLNCIKAYHKGRGGYIEMQDGLSVEVSVRKKESFLGRFKG